MKYSSIEIERCKNVNEKILKPFLCESCNKLPIKPYKLSSNPFSYYCEGCLKDKSNHKIIEENLGFACLLISCKNMNHGCEKQFYYGSIQNLISHEENCENTEKKGRFEIRNFISNSTNCAKINNKAFFKGLRKIENMKSSYEEKITKIIHKYEEERERLEKKVEYITKQNLLLEMRLESKSNLEIASEVRITIAKTFRNLNVTKSSNFTILKASKAKIYIKTNNASFELASKPKDEGRKLPSKFIINSFSLMSSNNNIKKQNDLKYNNGFIDKETFNLAAQHKINGSIFKELQNNNKVNLFSNLNSLSDRNSIFSTAISQNNIQSENITKTLYDNYNPNQNNYSNLSLIEREKENISKSSVTPIISSEVISEIKSVLNKMDPRYFSNFSLIDKLNNKQLTELHSEIRNTMSSCGKEYIPTKSNGTMDMRFSINKELVSLFKGYELLSKHN